MFKQTLINDITYIYNFPLAHFCFEKNMMKLQISLVHDCVEHVCLNRTYSLVSTNKFPHYFHFGIFWIGHLIKTPVGLALVLKIDIWFFRKYPNVGIGFLMQSNLKSQVQWPFLWTLHILASFLCQFACLYDFAPKRLHWGQKCCVKMALKIYLNVGNVWPFACPPILLVGKTKGFASSSGIVREETMAP